MHYDFVPMPERKPLKWPNGKRLALMITLNLEYWELTQDHDGTYFAGGSTSVDGLGNHDFQENTRYGGTLTLPLNRNNSIKLFASNGAHTRTGSEYDVAGIVWQYRFGGGL